MTKINRSDLKFNAPVVGIDPVTKGTFTIEWAWVTNDFWLDDEKPERLEAKGSFTIEGPDNPLYVLAKNTPLRLQEILGTVDFGNEKKFIQIKAINRFSESDEKVAIHLDGVEFEVLDNLDYFEKMQTYKDDNLL